MLGRDPLLRPSAAEALVHPWFKQDEAILRELLELNKLVCTIDVMNSVGNQAKLLKISNSIKKESEKGHDSEAAM